MIKIKKDWLQNVNRIHTVTEDKSKYFLRLDQNERIFEFGDRFFKDFLKTIKDTDIIAYPSSKEFLYKLSKYLGVYDYNLYLSGGSDQIIKVMFETFVNSGDEVIVTDPCFPMYNVYCKLFNATQIKIKYNEKLEFNIQDIIYKITAKTSLIIIANPNSPIGDYHYKAEFKELLDATRLVGIPVLIDEAYVEYSPGTLLNLINEYDNVAICRTFSKGMNAAGIRLGYLISNNYIIDLVSKWRHMHPINGIAARFGLYVLDNLSYINSYIHNTILSREEVVKQLKYVGYDVINSQGNWIHFNDRQDNKYVSEILNSYDNISSRDGCIIPYDNRKNWVRLTVGPNLDSYPFFKKILLLKK